MPQVGGRDLEGGGRPVPGGGAATAVRPTVRDYRQQVRVPAVDERGGPRAVHMPEQDPHVLTPAAGAAALPVSWSTALSTSAAVTEVRQGWPGTGQTSARLSRQGAAWSPSTT